MPGIEIIVNGNTTFLSKADVDILSGSINRRVRYNDAEDKEVKQLYAHHVDGKRLGLKFEGLQEWPGIGNFPMFTDSVTGSSFLIAPGETLDSALFRSRKPYQRK